MFFSRITQICTDGFLTDYTDVFLTDYTDLHRWFSHRFLRFAQIFFSQIPQILKILTDLHRWFLTGNKTRTDHDPAVTLGEENVSV